MKKFVFALTLLFTSVTAFAQNQDPWMEYMTPSKAHATLATYAGDFDVTITMWMSTQGEPMKVAVESANKMVLDGRFLQFDQAGQMMGMAYRGLMTLGYNNTEKRFALTGMSNIGTGTLFLSGPWKEEGKVAILTGQMTNPVDKKAIKVRQTITFVDSNTLLIENYDQEEGGAERKSVEYRFTRKVK
jgi:hypothetical protein